MLVQHALTLPPLLLGLLGASQVRADPNDWINPAYALAAGKNPPVGTTKAIQSVIHAAVKSSKDGPWSIRGSTIIAPSGDRGDYFSWAPYHWPDCNWCNSTHANSTSSASASSKPVGAAAPVPSDSSNDGSSNGGSGGAGDSDDSDRETTEMRRLRLRVRRDIAADAGATDAEAGDSSGQGPGYGYGYAGADESGAHTVLLGTVEDPFVDPAIADEWDTLPWSNGTSGDAQMESFRAQGHAVNAWTHNMHRPMLLRRDPHPDPDPAPAPDPEAKPAPAHSGSGKKHRPQHSSKGKTKTKTKTKAKSKHPKQKQPSHHTRRAEPGAPSKPPPAAATASRAAKAGVDKGPQVSATQKPSSTSKSPSCTPSTTYVAPTATYSVCKYKQRDGQVNPDVRSLNSSDYMGKVTQAGITNALAWVLTRDADYSRVASTIIDTFFADNATGMNPNLNYGQVVRGPPGNQLGSFMAVVDLRGLTKVANAVQLLRQSNSPDWTLDRDRRLVAWAKSYLNWLQTSPIGKKSGTAANNHGTFYANQAAALQILVGDYAGAKATLSKFFTGPFKEQISASGEQPFEAIRTRPFHYRAFNLEALIVNAKLADQLGLNAWAAQSKYNATIQTALDYTMKLDPKSEDPAELVPHVLAVAAAYGDPKGKYMAYVKKVMPDYDTRIYYLYDQVGAFTTAPTSGKAGSSASSSSTSGSGSGGSSSSSTTPKSTGGSSSKKANGKRDVGQQYGLEDRQHQRAAAGALGQAVRDGYRLDADAAGAGAGAGAVEGGMVPESSWHAVRDFNELSPPIVGGNEDEGAEDRSDLSLSRSGASLAGRSVGAAGSRHNSTRASPGSASIGSAWGDVLQQREGLGRFTDA